LSVHLLQDADDLSRFESADEGAFDVTVASNQRCETLAGREEILRPANVFGGAVGVPVTTVQGDKTAELNDERREAVHDGRGLHPGKLDRTPPVSLLSPLHLTELFPARSHRLYLGDQVQQGLPVSSRVARNSLPRVASFLGGLPGTGGGAVVGGRRRARGWCPTDPSEQFFEILDEWHFPRGELTRDRRRWTAQASSGAVSRKSGHGGRNCLHHELNIATVRTWLARGAEITPARVAALPGPWEQGAMSSGPPFAPTTPMSRELSAWRYVFDGIHWFQQ